MSKDQVSAILRSPAFRMSYANLLSARAFNDGKRKGKPEFNVEMLLKPEDLEKFQVKSEESGEWEETDIKLVLLDLYNREWGDDDDFVPLKEAVNNKSLHWPVVDGDAKADRKAKKGKKADAYRGYKVIKIKANEDYPPQLFYVDKGQYREIDRNDKADMAKAKDMFVSGYYAKASLKVQPNLGAPDADGEEKKFLTFYVNAIVFVRKGERIGGMSAEDRFGGVEGGESDYDPTEGLDDQLPV